MLVRRRADWRTWQESITLGARVLGCTYCLLSWRYVIQCFYICAKRQSAVVPCVLIALNLSYDSWLGCNTLDRQLHYPWAYNVLWIGALLLGIAPGTCFPWMTLWWRFFRLFSVRTNRTALCKLWSCQVGLAEQMSSTVNRRSTLLKGKSDKWCESERVVLKRRWVRNVYVHPPHPLFHHRVHFVSERYISFISFIKNLKWFDERSDSSVKYRKALPFSLLRRKMFFKVPYTASDNSIPSSFHR